MKISLTQTLVLHKLTIDHKPEADAKGRIVYVDNPDRTPYFVFDAHRDAPVGFGVKVSATKKTYLVQRRTGPTRVVKAKLGNVGDYPNIENARLAAVELANRIKSSAGQNPNRLKRDQATVAREDTLGAAFAAYREHLLKRSKKRAKPATIKVLDSAIRHFADWADTTVANITSAAIRTRFDAGITPHPSGSPAMDRGRAATEQRFRWASAAVRHALTMAAHEARLAGREDRLAVNPFDILKLDQRFRGKAELERDYGERQSRNPLGLREGTLGRFLAAVWGRRPLNRMGADYLLLTLLWGARRGESSAIQWRDRLTDAEAARCSWVDLELRVGRFHHTKNGTDFSFPLADAALEILKQRQDDRAPKQRYVFPVRSSKKTTSALHYTDAKSILANVKKDAGLVALRTHDLRRTMGRVAEELTSVAMVKRLLNHHEPGNPTWRYTDPEWLRFVEVIQKVELTMLGACPVVYNGLLPPQTYARMAVDADRGDTPKSGRSRRRSGAPS